MNAKLAKALRRAAKAESWNQAQINYVKRLMNEINADGRHEAKGIFEQAARNTCSTNTPAVPVESSTTLNTECQNATPTENFASAEPQ